MIYDVICDSCSGSGFDREDNNYGCAICSSTGFVEKFLYSPEEYASIREKLTKAEQQLDWLAHQDLQSLSMQIVQDAPHDGEYYVAGDIGVGYGKTFRDAINAAINDEIAIKSKKIVEKD